MVNTYTHKFRMGYKGYLFQGHAFLMEAVAYDIAFKVDRIQAFQLQSSWKDNGVTYSNNGKGSVYYL